MNVYHLSNPLPNLPHPPTIINMKIGRDGVYVATTVMSIPDFVATLTQPMRMMYNGLRRGIPPGRIAAYMGFPGDAEKFKAHLRQFLTVEVISKPLGHHIGDPATQQETKRRHI